MILVAGIPDEQPVARVAQALERMGAEHRVLDQRSVAACHLELTIADAAAGGTVEGTLALEREKIPLTAISGMYLRMMDDRYLPGIVDLAPDAPERRRCRQFHELLSNFADIAAARVLNRPLDAGSNHSKPYQAQLIRAAGFDVPETLITNDPRTAREFIERVWSANGEVVYKSISGIRSIVRCVAADDLDKLERIRWCPTQFQRRVVGTDIRVHVVGESVLAAGIASDATDYRYASREVGTAAEIVACEIDPAIQRLCVRLSELLRLPLAGIDLRRTPEGRYVCFEVNPSPAFSYYEAHTGLPIADRIAAYLAGEPVH